MKYLNICTALLMLGSFLTACDHDAIDDVHFGVTLEAPSEDIYVGDEVKFHFTGNPDYILFYSGEAGKKYANRNRVSMEVDQMQLSLTAEQRYTDNDFMNRQSLYIYVSEDFSGDYTTEGIDKATWTELSGTGEGKLKVPIPTSTAQTVSSSIDFSGYKDQKFYLGFRYNTVPYLNPSRYSGQPRIDIKPLTLEKSSGEQTVVMNNPKDEFGFRPVYVKSTAKASFNADVTMLLFQPANEHKEEVDVWMISQLMDAKYISPDMGTPIKAVDAKLPFYAYSYTAPGEYTVSFVARNANMWNTSEVVKEIKFQVKDR